MALKRAPLKPPLGDPRWLPYKDPGLAWTRVGVASASTNLTCFSVPVTLLPIKMTYANAVWFGITRDRSPGRSMGREKVNRRNSRSGRGKPALVPKGRSRRGAPG